MGWTEVFIAGFATMPPTILAASTLIKARRQQHTADRTEILAERAADQAEQANVAVNNTGANIPTIAQEVHSISGTLAKHGNKLDRQQRQLKIVAGVSQEALMRVTAIESHVDGGEK